jgi:hypothetical protein
MKTSTRTFGWYVTHRFRSGDGDSFYEVDPSESYANAPSPQVHLDNFKTAGLLDAVPTLENLVPLVEEYSEWFARCLNDWKIYEGEETVNGFMCTLHWTLSNIFCDPNIDVRVLRYLVENHTRFTITAVSNVGCPKDILVSLLKRDGKYKDTSHETNGGEIGCFILHNDRLASDMVNLCAVTTKKVSIQKMVVNHPNVSRDTLIYLSKEGRSESLKKIALRELVNKGWLEVK